MPRFTLETATVTWRGQTFTVRQMTAAEKMRWASEVRKDASVTLTLAVELCGGIDPPMSAAELALEPTSLVEALADKIFELNGEGAPEKKASPDMKS